MSRYPIYDLMRDYLTLSWARFSKDVQSHTLQISKILSFPAPRPGEIVRLDASAKSDGAETSLEVVARFPGGLDFGRGLVDINFTMWPLFKCLNVDNILTICEVSVPPAAGSCWVHSLVHRRSRSVPRVGFCSTPGILLCSGCVSLHPSSFDSVDPAPNRLRS